MDLSLAWSIQQEVGLRFSHEDLTLDNFCGLLTKDEVKMAGYQPSSFFFFCLFMDLDRADVLKCKKRMRSISSHLD